VLSGNRVCNRRTVCRRADRTWAPDEPAMSKKSAKEEIWMGVRRAQGQQNKNKTEQEHENEGLHKLDFSLAANTQNGSEIRPGEKIKEAAKLKN
jgi:hypothetical protein